jgi:hypothetical protein
VLPAISRGPALAAPMMVFGEIREDRHDKVVDTSLLLGTGD